jgi:beta-aspartyl-dipeptidase (metallo-type)
LSDAHAIGSTLRLFDEFQASVREEGLPLDEVLPYFTRNTAPVLQLPAKGAVAAGGDGDLLVLNKETLDLVYVLARGRVLLRDGAVVVTELYETETSD